MTIDTDTRILARCIRKCANASDGRAHEGARRQARNAMAGDVDIIDDAINAAWIVGKWISLAADASHAALDASYAASFAEECAR